MCMSWDLDGKRAINVFILRSRARWCARALAQPGVAPRLSAGQRDASPGAAGGRKERKGEQQPLSLSPPVLLPAETGWLSPLLPALCFFLKYRNLGEFSPLEGGGCHQPPSLLQWRLGLSPGLANVTVCTSQTGFGEKEENRECCHFLAMEKKLEN